MTGDLSLAKVNPQEVRASCQYLIRDQSRSLYLKIAHLSDGRVYPGTKGKIFFVRDESPAPIWLDDIEEVYIICEESLFD